jgi:hypothetical protein
MATRIFEPSDAWKRDHSDRTGYVISMHEYSLQKDAYRPPHLRGLLEMSAAFLLYRVVIAIAPLKILYIPMCALIMIPTVHPMRNHGGDL